jgi:AbrB family looped-hinge helix DNA binding protein
MATTVTSKGQVTIPKPVRDRLGIEAGTAVEFRMEADGRVVLLKVDRTPVRSRFEALRGIAGPGPSTDEIMAMLRGDD